MSLLTVACSNYNSERWIERYLSSLNEQLLPEFSVIIVDARSTDNSLNIIKQFKFREGINVKIISLDKRIGYYEAFNLITYNCETEYIVSYNTDDQLYPAALTVINEYIKKSRDTDIFYSSFGITKNFNHVELGMGQVHIPPEHDINILMHACYIGPFSAVKKAALLDVGGYNPEFKICGDYELWVRLARSGKKFTRIPEMIGSYYENPTGISTNVEDAEIRKTEELKIRLNKA